MSYHTGYVALIGRPNAGKSTLLNCILGQKITITSNKPETTRKAILGIKHLPHGQIGFLDTPGFSHTDRPLRLNDRMREAFQKTLRATDLILVLVTPTTADDDALFTLVTSSRVPKILVLNKRDRIAKATMIPLLNRLNTQLEKHHFSDLVPISAKTGENLDTLLKVVESHLPEGEPLFSEDQVTDQPTRFLAAEILREKVIDATREELPYVVAVQIEQYEERENGKIFIGATIFVEKTSQKIIVIGQKGEQLKKIGTAARHELEAVLEARVFLEIWVKVKKDWRQNNAFLIQSGYA